MYFRYYMIMVTLCKIICDHTHVHGAHRPGPISVQNDWRFEAQSFLTRGYGGGNGCWQGKRGHAKIVSWIWTFNKITRQLFVKWHFLFSRSFKPVLDPLFRSTFVTYRKNQLSLQMITRGTMFQLRPFEFERLLSKGDFVFTCTTGWLVAGWFWALGIDL